MAHPRSARVRYWQKAWMLSLMAALAAGCGDDESSTPAALGGSGGIDAGSEPELGDAALQDPPAGEGGAAGTESNPPIGGLSGAGVGGPTTDGSCTPGDTRPCTFERLCIGLETCGDDGTFIAGSCECQSSGIVGPGIVGARCASDADCAGGGTCLSADTDSYLGAGGPAGGYCTFSCTITSEDPYDDDCDTHDPESLCGPFGPADALICIRTCLSLDPDPGEAKCLNRPDLVCLSVAAAQQVPFNGMRQFGYCKPQCGSDSECPEGRFCHTQAGICTTAQLDLAPVGARCTLDTDCSGRACEDRDDENVGTCTAPCVYGSLSGCGYGRDADPRELACLQPSIVSGRFSEGSGDVGLCRELCDVAEDCERAADGWVCTEMTPAASGFFLRPGACTPPR